MTSVSKKSKKKKKKTKTAVPDDPAADDGTDD
jgi:hypothetical protein